MARLVTLRSTGGSPNHVTLDRDQIVVGRLPDVDLRLDCREVSRRHARFTRVNNRYYLEDLGSSNGTYVNGMRLQGKVELHEQDQIRIGPYLWRFEAGDLAEPEPVIRAALSAHASNRDLFRQDAERKLQAVLEISHHLSRSLDLDEILPRLLEELMRLFTQADRGLILLLEGDHLVARAVARRDHQSEGPAYSRSVVRRVLKEGVGIVAEDVDADSRFDMMHSVNRLAVRSFLCVPLKAPEDRPLGVVHLDSSRAGMPFTAEDLHLATAIALQAGTVIANAGLHAELLRKERVEHELILARKIQAGFLPTDFQNIPPGIEIFGRVCPATEVSGDFYDFQRIGPRQLAFTIADVVGKGIPAALYMTAARTLCRHLAGRVANPAEVLEQLNQALYEDNDSMMFVTLVHGLIHADDGRLVLASGGHPAPLIRRRGGTVEQAILTPGRPIGAFAMPTQAENATLHLAAGDTLLLYTDGAIEAPSADGKDRFGTERLAQALACLPEGQPLEQWCQALRRTVAEFTGSEGLADDVTLLLLRRSLADASASP